MKTFNDILVDVGEYTLHILSFLALTKLCYDLLCAMRCSDLRLQFSALDRVYLQRYGYFSERS